MNNNLTNTFGDYEFPSFVDEITKDSIRNFWGCFGRTHKDWLENSQQHEREYCFHGLHGFGNPKMGEQVLYARNGIIIKGKYIHTWNNIGRVIDEDGRSHMVSSCDMWCTIKRKSNDTL